MTQPTLIEFVDSCFGKCSAAIQKLDGGVAIQWTRAKEPAVEMQLSSSAAVELARAILAAAGANAGPSLPQSRQIGGIIGPY
jgi:hypothetical protein